MHAPMQVLRKALVHLATAVNYTCKRFCTIGFEWRWQGWFQFNTDLFRHKGKCLYMKCLIIMGRNKLPYFIEYNANMIIVHAWISQWFLAKKLFLFFKNNFTRINHCKFIHHKSLLKPFLSYLPCIVRREYFQFIKVRTILDKIR